MKPCFTILALLHWITSFKVVKCILRTDLVPSEKNLPSLQLVLRESLLFLLCCILPSGLVSNLLAEEKALSVAPGLTWVQQVPKFQLRGHCKVSRPTVYQPTFLPNPCAWCFLLLLKIQNQTTEFLSDVSYGPALVCPGIHPVGNTWHEDLVECWQVNPCPCWLVPGLLDNPSLWCWLFPHSGGKLVLMKCVCRWYALLHPWK